MAALTASLLSAVGSNAVTQNTLTASDTFVYDPTKNQVLLLRNATAGALTVNIVGNTATTVQVPQLGPVTVSTGYSTGSIAATTGYVSVPLNSIAAYLAGTSVTVTGGTGISAVLLQSSV